MLPFWPWFGTKKLIDFEPYLLDLQESVLSSVLFVRTSNQETSDLLKGFRCGKWAGWTGFERVEMGHRLNMVKLDAGH